MKHTKSYTLTISFLMIINSFVYAQVTDPGKVIKQKGDERINEKVNKGIDKGYDKLEKGIKGLFHKKKKKKSVKEKKDNKKQSVNSRGHNLEIKTQKPLLKWAKYDFIPGDNIIFEDNLEDEENGEFPSRWDLEKGQVEIAEFGGDKVIMLRSGEPKIMPFIKNASNDYLPDIFTVEFDLYCHSYLFWVYLRDIKHQPSVSISGFDYFTINYNSIGFGKIVSEYPQKNVAERRWIHISIAYTKGKLKIYMDDTRLINVPRIDFNPSGISFYTYYAGEDNPFYIKNVRIAKGGVKYYDRILKDGKIVANGIRFNVNSAVLLPESMGIINKIYELMKNHSELKFSVEGHTDSDGNDKYNLQLSRKRAQAVVNKLMEMGISADRLVSKGWGENKPVAGNDTPEGKANNRRVEFVKF